ncbi:LysR family transcriptional regulator [Sphingomonas kyungheensis]|uniref:LysR family transcriptional regulator n=1 Tax=Sphingomonas kyungheensis TaxID=1069987 RepID=A0ABU8H6D8_9SPHN
MRLDKFDLNLLVAFEALMAERSVTRAAQRLNLTQSATSASLKRLREAFQDELLVLHGKTMIPTPHALSLAPEIASAIVLLKNLISSATGFDPAVSERRFRIVASDYTTTVFIQPLLAQLRREAPHVRLDLLSPREDTSDRLAKGEYDLSIVPIEFADLRHPTEELWRERHVVVGWRDNPIFAQPIGVDAYAAAGHVVVQIDGRNTFIENALSQRGLLRKVEVAVPSFLQVPWLLPDTLRLSLMHERLAMLMAERLDLRIAPLPFDIPPMIQVLQYHSTRHLDQGLRWLRTRCHAVARFAPPPPDHKSE